MRVEGSNVVLESRDDVSVLETALRDYYNKHKPLYEEDRDEAEKVIGQLEALWYGW